MYGHIYSVCIVIVFMGVLLLWPQAIVYTSLHSQDIKYNKKLYRFQNVSASRNKKVSLDIDKLTEICLSYAVYTLPLSNSSLPYYCAAFITPKVLHFSAFHLVCKASPYSYTQSYSPPPNLWLVKDL